MGAPHRTAVITYRNLAPVLRPDYSVLLYTQPAYRNLT